MGCAFIYELPQIVMKYINNCIDFNEDGVIIGRTPFFCGIKYKSICDGTFQDKDICEWFSIKIEKGEIPKLNKTGEFGIMLIDKLLRMLTKMIPLPIPKSSRKYKDKKFPYFFRCKHPNCNKIATWGLKIVVLFVNVKNMLIKKMLKLLEIILVKKKKIKK